MKNKGFLFAMTLGFLLAAGTLVQAQQPAPAGPENDDPDMETSYDRRGGGPMRWMQALDLSDDQVAKLRGEHVKRQKDTVRLRADMETAHIDLWQEVTADKPDQGKIDNLIKQIGDLHGKILSNRIASIVYMRSILTPEQKKKLDFMGMGMMMPRGGNGEFRKHRMMHKK